MIIEHCIEDCYDIGRLEEKLYKKTNEIKEDLDIRIYLAVRLGENRYINYEIEEYIEEEDDIEDAINAVMDIVREKVEVLEC
jgi:hypothetical protein